VRVFIFGKENSVHGGFYFLVFFILNGFQGFRENKFPDDTEGILELPGVGKILNERGDFI
jgi:hypothetical protein